MSGCELELELGLDFEVGSGLDLLFFSSVGGCCDSGSRIFGDRAHIFGTGLSPACVYASWHDGEAGFLVAKVVWWVL